MRKHYYLPFLVSLLLFGTTVQAQILEGQKAKKVHSTIQKVRLDQEQQVVKFIKFEEAQQPNSTNLQATLKEVLSQNNQKNIDGLTLEKLEEKTDDLGYQQIKFQQYYKGVPIARAFSGAQVNKGNVETVIGRIYKNIAVNTTPSFDEKEALKYIQEKYNDATLPNKDANHNHHHHAHSTGSLVILKHEGKDYLCWDLEVTAELEPRKFYIDAHTGEIVQTYSLLTTCNDANGKTIDYGNRSGISTTFSSSYSKYKLHNISCGNTETEVHVSKWNSSTDTPGPIVDYKDPDNFWNDWTGKKKSAYQTYWGLHNVLDFYSETFDRDSYDDNGAPIIAYNEHYFYPNAIWHPVQHFFGFGKGSNFNNGNDDINGLDVIAHEFTHAVTQFSQNGLEYYGESGALNESFSDILAAAFEFHIAEKEPNITSDWLIGEDSPVWPGELFIRNMANPKDPNSSVLQPDTYQGEHWASKVHINSGVQNFWFYLLTEGKSGINDNNDNYSVTGIGLEKATKIAYRTLTVKLTDPLSDYTTAREASIEAAEDLFGACSGEVIQVKNAWHAVGVGSQSNCTPKPDLVPLDMDVATNTNGTITMSCKVKNIGVANANASYLMYILSDDPVYSSDDVLLPFDYVNALSPNTHSNENHTYTLPNNISGCNYILFYADANALVNEAAELNNIEAFEFCIDEPCNPPTNANISAQAFCSSNYAFVYCNGFSGVNKILKYKKTNETNWTPILTSQHYVYLPGLANGTYQYKFAIECLDGSYTNYSPTETFTMTSCKTGESINLEPQTTTFKVFPNPVQNLININVSGKETAEVIRIYDLQGRLIKEVKITASIGETIQVNLSDLKAGVYMLRINETHTEKIMKL